MKKTTLLLIAVLIVTVSCQSAPTLAPTPVPSTPTQVPIVTSPPPTPTLPPTRTPTPTPMPRPTGDLLYSRDFKYPAENYMCQESTSPYGKYYCQDGEYHAINIGGNNITAWRENSLQDFIAQAQIRAIGESGSVGLVFRGQTNPSRYYIFRIRPAGQFQLVKWPESLFLNPVIIPWTDSAAIKKGDVTNELEVFAQGTQITLRANGQQLASVADDYFPQGSLGPVATEGGHMAMSNIKVWALSRTSTMSQAQTPTVVPTRTPNPSQTVWRGDLHMHTNCSDGENSYEEMIQKALELQLDFIAVTDHDGIPQGNCTFSTFAKCQAETRLVCIPSAEQSARTFHLLAIGIQNRFSALQPLALQVEEIHRQGGLAIAAHPYDKTWKYTEDQLVRSGLDAMECARGTREENQQQLVLSDKYNIPCAYNSDAHKTDDLGKQYNVCSVPIKSVADLKAALLGKKCKMK